MQIELEGTALDGAPSRVLLERTDGPVALNGREIAALERIPAFRTTAVRADHAISMVEHLFAALAGLGVREGISVRTSSMALPVLDGCARRWCDALRAFELPARPARLRVAREGEVTVGSSRARFEYAEYMHLEVVLEHPAIEPRASWNGDARDFVDRIAGARTFLFEHDVDEMLSANVRAEIDPEMVCIVGENGTINGTRDEPARHKLLDLIGDLYLHGGPMIGRAIFVRPGHESNHAIVREALERGILA